MYSINDFKKTKDRPYLVSYKKLLNNKEHVLIQLLTHIREVDI